MNVSELVINSLSKIGIGKNKFFSVVIEGRAINLELDKAIKNYISSRLTLTKHFSKDVYETLIEDKCEYNPVVFLACDLMLLNAFLEIAFQPGCQFDFSVYKTMNYKAETYSSLSEIYIQNCGNLVDAFNSIISNIQTILYRPEQRVELGGYVIDKDKIIESFENKKKMLHEVCQMINISRELDIAQVSKIFEQDVKPSVENFPSSTKEDEEIIELSDDLKKIFHGLEFISDKNCRTIKALKNMFEKRSESLQKLLDANFTISISDNKRPSMFLSDQLEWEKYNKDASIRFSYSKHLNVIRLLSDLSEDDLQIVLTDGLSCYNRLKELFLKARELYFEIELNEIWPCYTKINISRVNWSDILVNNLHEQLKDIQRIAKDNPNGAKHIFKEKLIEGIFSASSHRATPPSSAWPSIQLYI